MCCACPTPGYALTIWTAHSAQQHPNAPVTRDPGVPTRTAKCSNVDWIGRERRHTAAAVQLASHCVGGILVHGRSNSTPTQHAAHTMHAHNLTKPAICLSPSVLGCKCMNDYCRPSGVAGCYWVALAPLVPGQVMPWPYRREGRYKGHTMKGTL